LTFKCLRRFPRRHEGGQEHLRERGHEGHVCRLWLLPAAPYQHPDLHFETAAGEFAGAIKAVKSICAKEGFKGMYAGYGSFLLRDLPFDAIEFVTYEQLRRAYKISLAGSREVNGAETAAMGGPLLHQI